ncbi:MAG: diversity-generating retroelement protein Avd [Gemmatimonadaceae bacterium]|nr:diversity-generating retroelement protein Avd [Gemmatimonadaceae bacterium]
MTLYPSSGGSRAIPLDSQTLPFTTSPSEPVAVLPALYDYLKWVAPKVAAFPRVHRFTLGDRLFSALLDILDTLIDAQYLRVVRRQALRRANAALDRLRYLLRLANHCQCLSLREYELACGHTLTVGRMVGGWLRHVRADQGSFDGRSSGEPMPEAPPHG